MFLFAGGAGGEPARRCGESAGLRVFDDQIDGVAWLAVEHQIDGLVGMRILRPSASRIRSPWRMPAWAAGPPASTRSTITVPSASPGPSVSPSRGRRRSAPPAAPFRSWPPAVGQHGGRERHKSSRRVLPAGVAATIPNSRPAQLTITAPLEVSVVRNVALQEGGAGRSRPANDRRRPRCPAKRPGARLRRPRRCRRRRGPALDRQRQELEFSPGHFEQNQAGVVVHDPLARACRPSGSVSRNRWTARWERRPGARTWQPAGCRCTRPSRRSRCRRQLVAARRAVAARLRSWPAASAR